MPKPLPLHRPHRAFATLVALCYLCVSALLPLHHNHDAAQETTLPDVSAVSVTASVTSHVAQPLHTRIAAHPAASGPDHCLACEWQAAQVSPALPAYTVFLTPPAVIGSLSLLPRAPRLVAIAPSSRAPPCV